MADDAPLRDVQRCDECGSDYFAVTSQMSKLCPECAHRLYGYAPCVHEIVLGRCTRCGWDGSVSAYVHQLRVQVRDT